MVRKSRTLKVEPPSDSLQAWMERTGLNATTLLRLLAARGCPMSKGTLSDILSKSRRCSLTKALVLTEITGVPVKNLIQWPSAETAAARAAEDHSELSEADIREDRTIRASA